MEQMKVDYDALEKLELYSQNQVAELTGQLKQKEKLQKVIDDVKEISFDAKKEIIELKLQVQQKEVL